MLSSQTAKNVIRGTVIDKNTREPLIGANILIADTDPQVGTITDLDGNYFLEDVPVEWPTVECSYTGYETQSISGRQVKAGRELVLDFEMAEGAISLDIGATIVGYADPALKLSMNMPLPVSSRSRPK